MNNTIFLSICIPTYNRSNYLKKCLESIISQDSYNTKDIEILISDNASPDNTQEVVKSFQDKFPNIRYIKNDTNLGAERNILNLLNNFQGEYFFLLTDDDILLPNLLAKLKQIITHNSECSVFLSSYEVFSEKQKRTYIRHTFLISKKIPKSDIKDIVKFYNASSVASRICIRREFIDTEGYSNHMKSLYPCMYLVGYAALNGTSFYTKDLLIRHTRENVIFWDYPDDYMLNDKINLIKDLSKFDNRFYTIAFASLIINDMPDAIIDAIFKRPRKFCKLIRAIYKMPQIKSNPNLWVKIFYNFFRKLIGIIARKIYKIFCKLPYHYYE